MTTRPMQAVKSRRPSAIGEAGLPLVKALAEPALVIKPRQGFLHLGLEDLWRYRELLYFLVWRDVKVRYKQTMMGALWAILQPLMTMLIFTAVFGHFVNVPSDGLPYPIFAYAALLPWSYFAQALLGSASSLVGNANLISKVYFPRLIIPLAAATTPAVDLVVSFVPLLAMMVWFGIAPGWNVLALPLFLLLALLTALAVSLWLSALNVRYRDVAYTVPFLAQLWMYASPVAYPVSLVPEEWRWLYTLNPMVGVIEGFRWALLGKQSPDSAVMAAGAAMVATVLLGGLVYFRRMERTFADMV